MLTKAALLAYERLHVAKGILERDWTAQTEKAAYVSKIVAAWHFDIITSGAASVKMLWLHHTAGICRQHTVRRMHRHTHVLHAIYRCPQVLNIQDAPAVSHHQKAYLQRGRARCTCRGIGIVTGCLGLQGRGTVRDVRLRSFAITGARSSQVEALHSRDALLRPDSCVVWGCGRLSAR